MPILRLQLPDQGEITHELVSPRVTIGRRPDNTIQIVDRSISAHHAELIEEDGHYRLHDLGSTNLTFVEGQPVADFHLHQPCALKFGAIACFFDPDQGAVMPRLSAPQWEKDLAFLRGENADLQGEVKTLQRQIDILSSARLVTKRADTTPFAAHNDTLRTIVSERDDLRHLSSGLKLELEKLRGELRHTAQERDVARQTCEILQAEKAAAARATTANAGLTVIAETAPPRRPVSPRAQQPAPQAAHTPGHGLSSTQRITLPLPAEFLPIQTVLQSLQRATQTLASAPGDTQPLAELATYASQLVEAAAKLGDHPIGRLSASIEALLQDFASRSEPPQPARIRTLSQAAELIARLLDPRFLDVSKNQPHPRVLAVDNDAALLQTLTASLELVSLPTTTCADSRAAQTLLENGSFDLLVLDEALPGVAGPTLCGELRGHDRFRHTPVILLTGEGTLEQRVPTSLGGGNDFLPKPFNSAELAVKAETWIWKNRFGLL